MLNKKVKSVILAAGKGTRMKSELPKVLHTIFNKSLLSYVIDAVNNTGYIDENFVIVGHEAEKVEKSDKLLKLKVSLGNEERQVVSVVITSIPIRKSADKFLMPGPTNSITLFFT